MFLISSLEIGQELSNNELAHTFRCGNMGGMRLSRTTNTLVIIADYTKGLYHDKWIAGTLHYTGTGKIGDQDINQYQNKTLAESDHNGYTIHLFEVMEPGIYTYCGIVTLTENPYTETQPDDEGNPRTVWMFPVRPTPENDVKKPTLFTFENWDDYKEHAASAEERYARQLANKKPKKATAHSRPAPIPAPSIAPHTETLVLIPPDIVGKSIQHTTYGKGVITAIAGTNIVVSFDTVGFKTLGYKFCTDNCLISFT